MLDVIKLFEERDTRDELGLGSIRDAFADMLFPGTSTIQTRARYFLFIPWIYRTLEGQRVSSADIGRVARDRELALIDALAQAGETDGVIGIDARRRLQRLPSSIYWRGLLLWGILRFQGSVDQYHRSLDSFYRRAAARDIGGESDSELVQPNWHGNLPDPPASFPGRVTLELEADEAEYLRDRIMTTAPRTLLAYLVNQTWEAQQVDFVWQHDRCSELPEELRRQLEHAQNFSETLHGAMLLYNLLLAQRSHQLDLSAEYEARLKQWADTITARHRPLAAWDRSDFWEVVQAGGAHIPYPAVKFAQTWLELVLDRIGPYEIPSSRAAQHLIEAREVALKRAQARLTNEAARRTWSGAAGVGQLSYRWPVARRHLADIVAGLARGRHDA